MATDKLTGLLLQKEFEVQLTHEVQRAMRYRRPLTLLMAEVDFEHFEKERNLRQGMPYTIYKQLGPIILRHLRAVDFAGRIGGERFAALLPETPLSGAFVAGDRLRQAVEAYEFMAEDMTTRVHVALSVGVATFPDHGTTPEELTHSAQKALQMAHRDGGNQCVVYPEALHDVAEVFRDRFGAPREQAASAPPSGGDQPRPDAPRPAS